jgi:hypothetical protein
MIAHMSQGVGMSKNIFMGYINVTGSVRRLPEPYNHRFRWNFHLYILGFHFPSWLDGIRPLESSSLSSAFVLKVNPFDLVSSPWLRSVGEDAVSISLLEPFCMRWRWFWISSKASLSEASRSRRAESSVMSSFLLAYDEVDVSSAA